MIDGLKFGKYSVPCTRGHGAHDSKVVAIDLHGQHIRDSAPFPDNRRITFWFEVYDALNYEHGQWCHGNSAVSEGILKQGVWESYETRLMLEIFHEPKGHVLDFGANMGWYTVIAALHGHDVIAFEMEPETAQVLDRNVHRNDCTDRVKIVETFIDDKTPRLAADTDVLLLKSDVEGSEFAVVDCCWDMFEHGRIKYALLEISPCFKPGYGELMQRIMDAGYTAHVVPNKRSGHRERFGLDPIGFTTRAQISDPIEFVGAIRQENVLMVRR